MNWALLRISLTAVFTLNCEECIRQIYEVKYVIEISGMFTKFTVDNFFSFNL